MGKHQHIRILSAAVVAALSLTACGGGGGGGGGNVRPDPPPTSPPPPPPPQTCEDPNATNQGEPLPCTYRYNGVADNTLVGTNADGAHALGYTGAGVEVGLLDDAQITPYAPLEGQVASYRDYTGEGPEPDTNRQRGHGNAMGAVIAGKPVDDFKGGVAPDARLHWTRTCYDNFCSGPQTQRALSDLTALGVRLFNYSIGGYVGEGQDLFDFAAGWSNYATPVLDANGLFVAATGNDGKTTPGGIAAVPHAAPEFSRNWLAVSSVTLDDTGQVSGLASYANHCGLAAEWCLVAPGLHTIPAIPGTEYTWAVDGTSSATAAVTGVGALVWQAFPWMTGANVQETLLTTATDLGAAGVDSMYGWGLVNAEKAVQGPAQFRYTFDANVTGESTFAHDITGAGGLVKRGDGTLTLEGENTFGGDTRIEQGTLQLTGSVASNVDVLDGGTFASRGGRIGGDFSAAEGANTAIEVGNPLEIAGDASLDGMVTLLAEADDYQVQSQETLLTARAVSGTFDEVQSGSGFFWNATLRYDATSVQATLTRASAQAMAVAQGAPTQVIQGAGQADALIRYTDALAFRGETAGHEAALDAAHLLMSIPTAQAAADALASLTGDTHAAARSLSLRQALDDGRVLADRTALLATVEDTGAWLQVNALDGTLGADGYTGANYRQDGLMAGIDGAFGNGFALGASVGHARHRAGLNSASGDLDGTRTGLAVYGRHRLGRGYVSGVLGYDRSDAETVRNVMAGATPETVTSDRDDTTVHARIEAGMQFNAFTPYAAFGALRQTQEAFIENGSALGLAAREDTHTVRFADLGVRFARTRGHWTWGLDAAARWLLSGRDPDYTATFIDAPEAVFTVEGLPLEPRSLRLGAQAVYRPTDRLNWYFRIAGESSSGDNRTATGTVGLRWAF